MSEKDADSRPVHQMPGTANRGGILFSTEMKTVKEMISVLNALRKELNCTKTENGAAALRSTGSDCLDLFATIGALRNAEEADIVNRFIRAWSEDRNTAMKLLFYSRDVRGGLGERRTFRVILRWLAEMHAETVIRNIVLISEYGRWDDVMVLIGTPCEKAAISLIKRQLENDLAAADDKVSLMAKWLPSVNASNRDAVLQAKHLAKALGMNDAGYRKTLVKLRARIRILENNLREKDYTFDYAKQPSKAMLKYRKAFIRNDQERYDAYMEQVSEGKAQLHTGTLMPYDIVHQAMRFEGSASERRMLDVTWNALPNFTDGSNALCVVDGSGSMYSGMNLMPIDVAMSLGIYFAERNTGCFHNHFITFSHTPRLVEIKGRDIVDKVNYCRSFGEVADTNIQKVFELILKAADRNHVPENEMPETLYFISDMEFNCCTQDAALTNFEYAKKLFAEHGYRLPKVVFWNVNSRNEQQPVSMNEQGVTLVSGSNARVFSMVMEGELEPYAYMMSILGGERYAAICA